MSSRPCRSRSGSSCWPIALVSTSLTRLRREYGFGIVRGMKGRFPICIGLVFLAVAVGCQSTAPQPIQPVAPNNLTHGAVQLKLQKGTTTQNDVILAFGAPNITTIDGDGNEVWTYRRHATVTSAAGRNSYFNIVVFGASSESAGVTASSQSMTLVIKFGPDKKVTDFQSMATSF